jgi:tetratricopeptide (TPR) repeat protein
MSATHLDWYWDHESLVGELRRAGYGPTELPRIPGFDDIREIRRGGQGIVFSAIQRSTKRRVAIKVLLEGAFASSTGRMRFEREIDLVAGLRHPNIVSVHDSGTTPDGRSYFVMEFIDGQPLDQYAAKSTTTTPDEWLRLFAKICDAVNYAHQRGVIHRDLKPGNILIDTTGEPHVCDFGLAKSTLADDAAKHEMSVTGQFMGSLPWASPEQLEGSHTRVDVRTDVYSLGVILYQMLCGRMPFDSKGGIRQLFDNIMQVEPPRPSAVAKNLNDEIDTIVMKCLAKESLRRYQSAAELVSDVRHYLAGEPIQAKRDSAWYTLLKTMRRYQVAAGITAVVVAALAIALVISVQSWQEAKQESSQRAAIGSFLERMLTSVDPGRDGRDVKYMEVLDKAAAELGATMKDQPVVEAQVRRTLGTTYSALGMYEPAEKQLRAAYELASKTLGATHRDALELLAVLPEIAAVTGRMEEAQRDGQSALDTIRGTLGDDDPLTLRMMQKLADILNTCGKTAEAETMLRAALDRQRRRLGEVHDDTQASLNSLAVVLKQTGRIAEAEGLYRQVLKSTMQHPGPRDAGVLTTMNNLALVLQNQGKLDESEAMQRATLQTRLEVLGEEHPDTLINMSNLATLLIEQRKLAEAEKLLQQVVDIESRTLGPDNPATLTATNNLAKVTQDLGRFAEAEKLFKRALEGRQKLFGPEHAMTLMSQANLAALYGTMGRTSETVGLLRQILEARQRTLGENHFDTIVSMNNLALVLQKDRNYDEAAKLFEGACDAAAKAMPPGHYLIGLLRGNYGRCLVLLGKRAEAEGQFLESCANLSAAFGEDDPRTQQNIRSLIDLYDGSPDKKGLAGQWRAKLAAASQPAKT